MRDNSPASITRILRTISIAFVIVLLSAGARAQTNGSTPLGLSPGSPAGSYPLSDFETINLFNGGLNFRVPLLSVGGRGGSGYSLPLHIEQKWSVSKEINPGHTPYYYGHSSWWSEDFGTSHTLDVGRLQVRRGGTENFYGPDCAVYRYRKTVTRITFTAPDGTEYELRDQLTGGQPAVPAPCSSGFNRQKVFVTADGTSATYISDEDIIDAYAYSEAGEDEVRTSGYMMLHDGTRFRLDNGNITWMRDRNGNKTSFTYDPYKRVTGITDSLNRQVTITYDISSGGPPYYPYYDQISFKGFGGATRTLKIGHCARSEAMRSDITVPYPLFPGLTSVDVANPTVINYVELPDGRRYQIQYDAYAEIARVVMPTGGAIEYDWAKGLTDGDASGLFSIGGDKYVYRRVVERRLYPDGGSGAGYESRMTYSRPETTTTNAGYVLVDQYNSSGYLLGHSQHYFYGSPRASFGQKQTDYPAWQDGREYKTETFDTNGTTLLRRVESTFAQRAPVSWWTESSDTAPPNDVRLIEAITTLADSNQVSKRSYGYDDSVPYNNQNNVKEFDYGTGVSGTLLRETRTTFLTATNYTGTDVHLRNLATQVSVYDGNGVERARSTSEYDNYAADSNHAALLGRSGISGFDSSFSGSYATRGNVTASTSYLLTNGSVTGSVSSYSQYDIAGNVVKTIDGRGNAATIYYDDRFGTPDGEAQSNLAPVELSSQSQSSYAFATRIKNAADHISFGQFDYYLGRPVDGEDANGNVASGYYNDVLDRPTQVRRAVGTSAQNQTSFSYDDANRTVTTSADLNSNNDNALVSTALYDMLGRTIETRQYEGGSNYIAVQQQYDPMGRAYRSSNPFRPWKSESAVWTTSAFDALGRVTSVTTPDNALVTTSYSGNSVRVNDQQGKQRKSVTDGLGRLVQVYEAPNDPTYNYLTSYSYDTLDNLTMVSQGSQTRTFVYDSLKRLSSATNPESGTISYQYDDNGNLTQKTDARGVVSTYAYDVLNRNTTVDYSDTPGINPDINRYYDGAVKGKGRFWYDYAGGILSGGQKIEHHAIDFYDAMGRPTVMRQHFLTGGVYDQGSQVSRTYDLAGHVLSQTYPSGRVVNYQYDSAGRTSSFTGNLGDGTQRTYATGITYASAGQMAQEQFGTQTQLYHKLQYNVRGQLYDIRLSTVSQQVDPMNWNRGALVLYYSSQGGWVWGGSGTDNNGNVQLAQHWVPNDDQVSSYQWMNQYYNYDALNRITSVTEQQNGATNTAAQYYTYDRYGNRLIDQANTWGTGINKQNFTVNAANNQLGVPGGQSGVMTYDSAGNLTTDTYSGSGVTRAYDAENRMTSETQANNYLAGSYNYSADGQRVRRKVGNVETWQIYGFDGELLAEYATNTTPGSPQKEYGYRNGQLLITAAAGQSQTSTQNVTWTNAVGVSVSGNNLTKTAGDSWDNAGAASTQSIASGDGYVEFTATETNTYRMCGLSNGDTNQSYTDIDFAIYAASSGMLQVYEGGALRGNFGSYNAGDTFRVAVEGGVVKYRRNGALFYTSTVAPSYPLLVDTSLYSNGSTVNAVVISGNLGSPTQNVSWTNSVGVSVAGNSLTKTAGDAWGNAGAASTQSITSGDGYVEFTASETNTYRMLGLSHGDTDQGYADIDFAIYLAGGVLAVYEGGGLIGNFGTYNTGDTLRVAVESGGVKYRKNGTLFYTSTSAPTYPLLVDTSLYSSGATINNVVMSSGGSGGGVDINWLVTDQLGTPRMVVDQTGSLANIKRHDYLPFGEELFAGTGGRTSAQGYGADSVRQKFTQKERDNETGLDYFGARYYSSTQGRFTSPDPLLSSGRPIHPQSWNRYSYVINQPLSLIDPDGLDWGVADWTEEDGTKHTEYRWFYGEIGDRNGHHYTAVNFGGDANRTVFTSDGRTMVISNDPAHRLEDVTPQLQAQQAPVLPRSWVDHVPVLSTGRQFLFDYTTENFEGALGEFGKMSAELGTLNVGASAAATKAFATEAGEAIFYSGGKAAFQAATEAATTEGGKTIGMTAGGKALEKLTGSLPEGLSRPIWNWASKHFAEGASGNVRVFLREPVRSNSTWNAIERPILRVNPFVRTVPR